MINGVIITDRDRAMAQRCVECPVCNRARRKQRGAAFWFVKRIEGGVCPFCQAYEKVNGRKAHEPSNSPDAPAIAKRTSRKSFAPLRFLAVFALALLVLIPAALHPWYLRWGATDRELQQPLPGDELVFSGANTATRAITIQSPPEQIWPWIVQIGEDRAGFYSYMWLENLFLADMHNSDRIVPEWQTRQLGDTVWMARKDRFHGRGRAIVAALQAHHAMVLVSPDDYAKLTKSGPQISGAWTFIVEPEGKRASRLIMRTLGVPTGPFNRAFNYFVYDPAHFIMERKMLLGIKERAERYQPHP
jgi:hypothetical protein